MAREVMFVGSLPLKPAFRVFQCACEHGLKPLMRRIPDGEQSGWAMPLMASWQNHPALEPDGEPVPLTRRPTFFPFFQAPNQCLKLKPGHSVEELMIDDMGFARGAADSYAQFKQAKAEGLIAADTRFVATVPGPSTVMMVVIHDPAELFPVISRAYRAEIARLLKIAPANELAIQIDLAGEVEGEEYHRRPEAWDSPLVAKMDGCWPFDLTSSLIAEISDAIPEPVQLGYHLCASYHVDESQGQDLNVHVDWANALTEKVKRGIDYIHIPTTREHDGADFEPLRRLKLTPRTKLYLGLIHAQDGLEGARRRIKAAAQVRPDFGVASFCGLQVVSLQQSKNPTPIDQVLDLHRAVAEVD